MTTTGRTQVDGTRAVTGRADARQLLTGVIVSGVFGLAWGQWAASGLPHAAQLGVRIASTVLGVTIVARAARLRRAAPPAAGSMFRSPAYRAVVAAEVAALVVAVIALVAAHGTRFLPVAVAAAAGLHFAGFGYLFDRMFHALAAGLLLAAVVGLVVGLRGGSSHTVEAVTGLIAAVVLFVGATVRLVVVGAPSAGPIG